MDVEIEMSLSFFAALGVCFSYVCLALFAISGRQRGSLSALDTPPYGSFVIVLDKEFNA